MVNTSHDQTGNRLERLLARWRRIELPIGLLLVAGGFIAVALGWYDASGTGDVRRQMQALISGGFGGLAAVVLGAAIVQAHVQSKGTRQLADKFERVADALLDLAYTEGRAESDEVWRPSAAANGQVLASHASYHLAGCDVAAGREGLRTVTIAEAEAEGLRPCGVCLPAAPLQSPRPAPEALL